jgi:hypothetical protein
MVECIDVKKLIENNYIRYNLEIQRNIRRDKSKKLKYC